MEVKMTWKRLVVGTTVASAMMLGAAFVGAKLALATPGGETRNTLSFAGTLRTTTGGPATATTLTFTFRKGTTPVCAPTAAVTPDSNGAFVAQIPIDACPRSLFDGSDVVFDVAAGSNVIARDQAVNPVPYARYADQAGVGNDCPAGYARDSSASPGTICFRSVTLGAMAVRDEVVKVGSGAGAFWIDRYESEIHHGTTGAQLAASNTTGGGADDLGTLLPRNGQHTATDPRSLPWALSHPGPPTVNVTWFQANVACSIAGKQLASRGQWILGATGTQDNSNCNTSSSGVRPSASTNACVSAWGAHDMIGNVLEWTDEWYAGLYQNWGTATRATWGTYGGAPYGGDGSWNITVSVAPTGPDPVVALPAAGRRGGDYGDGTAAGVFAIHLEAAPTYWGSSSGFRCVVSR